MNSRLLPAALLLGGLLPAQSPPTPPPGIPVTMPTAQPALAGQPLIGTLADHADAPIAPPAWFGRTRTVDPATQEAMAFRRVVVEGRELKSAVDRVRQLVWHERFADASALAAAQGRPIFWINALGDLDGFA